MVTYLPVGDTPGICCSNPIAKKKMFAYLDQRRIVYILLMITLNPPSELLKEKPWDEGKEVVLSRRDFVPFELFTLREVIDGVWRFIHKLDVKCLSIHLIPELR